MKLRDRIGNEIVTGDTLFWQLPSGNGLKASVISAVAPGSVRKLDGSYEPGKLRIEVEFDLPMPEVKKGQDPKNFTFTDMVKTFDPDGERMIEDSLKAGA